MRHIKSIFIAVAVGFGGATAALAADMAGKAPLRADPPALYSWTGVYAGGSIGWLGTANIGGPFNIPAAPGNSFIAPGIDGGVYGGFLGVQYQWDRLVLGVEGGARRLFNNNFTSTPGLGNAPPVGCNAAAAFSCQGQISTIYQIGPRLGWAFYDKLLVYGTGGYAKTDISTQAITNATGAPLAFGTDSHPGWFAGGGLDYAVFSYQSTSGVVGIDYNHYEFEARNHNFGINGRLVSTTADSVTARFSLKLNAFNK